MKTAIILLADGFEEVEVVTPISYLNHAGVEVTMVAIGNKLDVTGMHGITVRTTALLQDLLNKNKQYDVLIIPGGTPCTQNIALSKEANALIRKMASDGKIIGAINESPVIILAPLGLLRLRTFTCCPGMENQVKDGKFTGERVVIDGNIVTSRLTGTAGEFSIAIIKLLLGEDEGEKVAKKCLL
jgi:4-methyl-5(b-hydroxyethyl)-thiazole monophosphate biosynthesis